MSMYGSEENPSRMDIGGLQLTIISQLFQVVASLHHIDELLQWLTSMIVQQFHVPVAETWGAQPGSAQHPSARLRTLACRDASIPRYIVTNDQVAGLASLLLSERHSSRLQPVNKLFTSYQATLMSRYGLIYCSGYFLSNHALPLAPRPDGSGGGSAHSLEALMLLFLHQPVHPDVISTIGLILDQAVQVAENHGLLASTPAPVGSGPLPTSTGGQPVVRPNIAGLIPRRSREAELLMSSNPLSGTVDIADKQARHLYKAIDGRRNVEQLCTVTRMSQKEVLAALQVLVTMRRIELYEPHGRLVDARQLF